MGLFRFGKKKVDKGAWSEAIWGKRLKHPEKETEKELSAITTGMLIQYQKIISESVGIIQTTHNEDTKQGRIALCQENYNKMLALKPFCDSRQMTLITQAEEMLKAGNLL